MSVEVKICGITTLEDALKAIELGADYLGFILYKKSPRYIEPAALELLTSKLPADIKRVGVFVNSPIDEVLQIADQCSLSVLQFHGDEDLRSLPALPLPAWKAVRLSPNSRELPADASVAERILIDTAVAGMYGGTGTTVDLTAAERIARQSKCMLGGGMSPDNVAEAIARVNPLGVDVSSGVESEPGKKDHAKLEAFFASARSA